MSDAATMFLEYVRGEESRHYEHDVSGQKRDEGGQWIAGPAGHPSTPEFKKWFANSHASHPGGVPMPLYHGTTKDFDEFNPNKGLSITDRLGSWLAVDPKLAEARLKSWEKAGPFGGSTGIIPDKSRTIKAYASIQNPKIFKNRQELDDHIEDNVSFPHDLLKEAVSHFAGHYKKPSEHVSGSDAHLRNYYANPDSRKRVNQDVLNGHDWDMSDDLMNRLRDHVRGHIMQHTLNGHDGIRINDDKGNGAAYIAFHPHQVKSAMANKGTFDPKDNRINYESGERPMKYDAAEAFVRHIAGDPGDEWEDDEEDEDEDEKHEFASTQVQLPEDIATAIRRFASTIPDADLAEEGRQDDIHITVKYGIEDNTPESIAEEIKHFGDVVVRLGRLSIFANDDADVLKVDVWSGRQRTGKDKSLYGLNKAVKRSVSHTETHPRYIPHVTVAYLKVGEGAKYEGLPIAGVSDKVVIFNSLMFSDKERKKTEIVFGDV